MTRSIRGRLAVFETEISSYACEQRHTAGLLTGVALLVRAACAQEEADGLGEADAPLSDWIACLMAATRAGSPDEPATPLAENW